MLLVVFSSRSFRPNTRTIVEHVPAIVQVLAESSGMISCAQRVLQAVDQRAQVMKSPQDLWSLIQHGHVHQTPTLREH